MRKEVTYIKSLLLFLVVVNNAIYAQKNTVGDTATFELPGVVVSASRVKEQILQTPVSIEKLALNDIKQNPQPSFFDAIENVKGIQMITPSLGFKVINARGFTNTTNVRFVQMVDGIDIQAPHIGAPMANALGPGDLDIQSVEIIPGSSSAIYGMNAINGTANFITKDPFLYQGLSMQQKTGLNHFNDANHSPTPFSETGIRYTKAFHNKLAIKVNAAYNNGIDWYADNRTDLNPNANISTGLTGNENPGSDRVNIYADEQPNRKTLTLGSKQYIVSRTGYAEKDITNYNIQNLKADVGFTYKIKNETLLSYTYRIAQTNTIYQRTNRFRLDNYLSQQHSITLKTGSLQARTYINTEHTGNSYNIRSMAENIERSFKPDDHWFKDFGSQFNKEIANGMPVSAAMQEARSFADNGRPVPHTSQTEALIAKLRNINDWNIGAALRVRTSMVHAELQHDLTGKILKQLSTNYKFSLMYGFDFREYIVVPDGNYFINPTKAGSDLKYWKVGGFVQSTKYLFNNKLKVNAVLRVDKNQYFAPKPNPRIAFIYSPNEQYSVRISLQQGYRFPSLFEAFSTINSGGVKRVGGLRIMSNGIFENSYLRSSIDAFQVANTNDVNLNGLTVTKAIEKNKNLLKQNTYTYLQPEQVKGIEAGLRANLFNNKLSIDLDFYYNIYSNLMAQVEANIPSTNNADSIPFYFNDKAKQQRYRLWTNSKTISHNYGTTIGVKWNLPLSFVLNNNVTFSKLSRTDQSDGLEDGFNTPKFIYNASFGNSSVGKHFAFQLNYRYQSGFLWQSSLATGMVPSYSTFDGQIQYNFNKNKFNIKLGATNFLNKYYYSFIGGPAIGGAYYCTTTFSIL